MQRYFAKGKEDNLFILYNKDLHHIKNVMRMKDSDLVEIVYENSLYLGKVNYSDKVNISCVNKINVENSSNMPKVTLIVPLLKENKMDLILQKSTELGVAAIIPVITERTLIKVEHKEDKKLERWRMICKEASEQSKRLNIPNIESVKKIDDLKGLSGLKVVCSTSQGCPDLKKFLQTNHNYDRIFIAIGPEGGLSASEEQKLNSLGFTSISLGKNILRVETVPLVVLSMINYEYME